MKLKPKGMWEIVSHILNQKVTQGSSLETSLAESNNKFRWCEAYYWTTSISMLILLSFLSIFTNIA